jgi:predicted metal-dependent hydrolase
MRTFVRSGANWVTRAAPGFGKRTKKQQASYDAYIKESNEKIAKRKLRKRRRAAKKGLATRKTRSRSAAMKKAWATRKKKYGKSGGRGRGARKRR